MRLTPAACCALVLCTLMPAAGFANDQGFPFDHELYLDVSPMPGSKRVPGLEVRPDGRATIDLWCASGPGQVVIAADTITIIPGPMNGQQCPPERAQADDEVLRALNQVTAWRREQDVVILTGPMPPLRFHMSTH